MIFKKDEVHKVCKQIAPIYGFGADLIFAMCLIEGARHGDTFEPDIARLEQIYYRKYVEAQNDLATTSEVLLSASYGIPQMMGLSLKEAGYFEWYFNEYCTPSQRTLLNNPYSQFAIPNAIDFFCVNLEVQIKYMCMWLQKKKEIADGDMKKTISLYNGDKTGAYYNKVMSVYESL